ncbi:MAG: glutamate--tRNA ligase [Elusimicrobia bacterium RIFOXYA2_FULL_39_19]|nr:MAG: glutamate--tRNA ligase [Elusimicrobia bacterium RIFOXYA2_FULL_39_19]
MSDTKIRVRFAPSPTGYLHIGGARTALFNWLFAKKTGGTFILRIEDTDEARSTDESVNAIFESMQWLGLDWDEGPVPGASLQEIKSKGNYGPYFQMQRIDIYQKYAQQLLKDGKAYHCYCSSEELEQARKDQLENKGSLKYSGKCKKLSQEEKNSFEAQGKKPVIRFNMPAEGKTGFDDLVRGRIDFENAQLDDFVILKASGIPTYNFACTVDDHLMEITHILRGDDHLSNTPRQIQLYNALGFKNIPLFGHLSMILGPDGARLSKRHGATSIMEYRQQGYLPETIVNYLVLLGWSTVDSQQLFEKEEMIQKFSADRCSKAAAVFDPQKLLWMNGEYVRKTPVERLLELASKSGFIDISNDMKYNLMKSAVSLEQEKIKLLTDIAYKTEFFFKEVVEYDPKAVEKTLKTPVARDILTGIKTKFSETQDFTKENLEKLCRELAIEKGIKPGQIFHPVRVAVSGRTEGPCLFGMLALLAKERVMQRIDYTLKNLVQ